MSPLVSVCIPAYNSARHIGETVASILAQTHADLELIVVDDCSTDGTADVVAGFDDPRLSLVRNDRNLGPVDNWNKALHACTGEFVKLVCSDDFLYESCLATQVSALEAAPTAVMSACRRDVVDDRGRVLVADRGLDGMSGSVSGLDVIGRVVSAGTNILGEPVCVLMRRTAVQRVGAFRGHVPYMIDVEYWCRLLALGDLAAVPSTLCAFRVLSTSWSNRIGRDQARQAVHLLDELAARHPDVISAGQLRQGKFRARALNRARLVLYGALRARTAIRG